MDKENILDAVTVNGTSTQLTLFKDDVRIIDFVCSENDGNYSIELPGERDGDEAWTTERALAGLDEVDRVITVICKEPKPEKNEGVTHQYELLVNGKPTLIFGLSDFHLHARPEEAESLLVNSGWDYIRQLGQMFKNKIMEVDSVQMVE